MIAENRAAASAHLAARWHQWLLSISPDDDVYRGVRVDSTIFNEALEAKARTKVHAALDLLHEFAPRQLERMQFLFASVCVIRLRTALGQWRSDLRTALLHRDYVLDPATTPERIASTLVHELMHARLGRAGFAYVTKTRARCERVCFLAERNFISRLPVSSERTELETLNARYLGMSADYWTDASFRNRYEAWRMQLPGWRRVVHDVTYFIVRAHRAALASDDR